MDPERDLKEPEGAVFLLKTGSNFFIFTIGLVIMIWRSMKTGFPSPDSVPISHEENLDVPDLSHQHSPDSSETLDGQDVNMTDIKESQQIESVSVRAKQKGLGWLGDGKTVGLGWWFLLVFWFSTVFSVYTLVLCLWAVFHFSVVFTFLCVYTFLVLLHLKPGDFYKGTNEVRCHIRFMAEPNIASS